VAYYTLSIGIKPIKFDDREQSRRPRTARNFAWFGRFGRRQRL